METWKQAEDQADQEGYGREYSCFLIMLRVGEWVLIAVIVILIFIWASKSW